MGKVVVESITITPDTVETGETITIEIEMHEEYAGSKRYAYKYPERYAGKN